jgi:hypothetical protein
MEEQQERFYDEDIYDILNKMCCGPSSAVEAPRSVPRSSISPPRSIATANAHLDSKGEPRIFVNFDIGSPAAAVRSASARSAPVSSQAATMSPEGLASVVAKANLDLEAAAHDLNVASWMLSAN